MSTIVSNWFQKTSVEVVLVQTAKWKVLSMSLTHSAPTDVWIVLDLHGKEKKNQCYPLA